MTSMTRAKWKVRAFLIPFFIVLAPLLVVIFGVVALFELLPQFIEEEYRWAKLVDDYDVKI